MENGTKKSPNLISAIAATENRINALLEPLFKMECADRMRYENAITLTVSILIHKGSSMKFGFA
jgi:hypothetical protein